MILCKGASVAQNKQTTEADLLQQRDTVARTLVISVQFIQAQQRVLQNKLRLRD